MAADNEVVVEVDGRRLAVPALRPRVDLFLNRSIVLFGPSGSGKSRFIRYIMYLLRSEIPQALVWNPTEDSNGAYRGLVPPGAVHLTPWAPPPEGEKKRGVPGDAAGIARYYEMVYELQEAKMAAYKRATTPEMLARLFDRLPTAARDAAAGTARAAEASLRRRLAELEAEAGPGASAAERARVAARVGKLRETCRTAVEKIRRITIVRHLRHITAQALEPDERAATEHVALNPHLLLVFDDCGDTLKAMWKLPIMNKLFYRARHAGITVIWGFQNDGDLSASFRKNAFITVYAASSMTTNFGREASGFSAAEREKAEAVVPAVFAGEHRKLVHVREDPEGEHFYHYTVPPHPSAEFPAFRFGDDAYWELVGAVCADEPVAARANRFQAAFA